MYNIYVITTHYCSHYFKKGKKLADRDGDEQLTENEFSDLPSEGVGLDLREDRQQSIGGSEDRRKEFRHLIDKNKNGKADRTELLVSNIREHINI